MGLFISCLWVLGVLGGPLFIGLGVWRIGDELRLIRKQAQK